MRQRHLKKKIGSLVLAAAMTVVSFPTLGTEAQAAGDASGRSLSAFATKEQLKDFNTDDTDGSTDSAKLYFGNNDQEWWIAGCQGGDSVTLFAASPLAESQQFEPSYNQNKNYSSAWNCDYTSAGGSAPSDVYPNHYGASPLRDTLRALEGSKSKDGISSCFTSAEQNLMKATTIYTNDTKNSSVYSTTEKLYLAYGDYNDDQYITAGRNSTDKLNGGLRIDKGYWNSGTNKWFWLRAPYTDSLSNALAAWPGRYVTYFSADIKNALVPAFELNLSSVLFASAAKAASSETPSKGTIEDGTAMKLRLDGAGKAIGTAVYDATAGKIAAQKDAEAAGNVSLVVQGNDGTKDWYYSVQAGGKTVVTEEQIKDACSLSGEPDLADCKIWLETTEDNVAYARMAEAKTIKTIDAVSLTGVKPAGGSAFPAKASCGTEGVDANSLAVTYTAKDTSEVATGTAEWNTAYRAGLTLAADDSGSTVYVFGDPVSVTVDGGTAQNVRPNADGTLTVTEEFTTARRKIAGISAPSVPSGKVFAEYYTAENILSDTNRELGKTAALTLEGSASPNTVNADVAWTLANSGGTAYNAAPGAGNTFRWTIAAGQIQDYDASGSAGYDGEAGTVSGTVTISNKEATPVTITGNNQTLTFDGSTIDVSKYFTIDANAGIRSYALVQDTGVTGQGSLSGTKLTVTKPGVF